MYIFFFPKTSDKDSPILHFLNPLNFGLIRISLYSPMAAD